MILYEYIYWRFFIMALTDNEMANSYEFTVEKKLEGKYRTQRVLMYLAHIFLPIIFMIALMALGLGAIALIVFIPVYYVGILRNWIWPMTTRYVFVEYEYVIRGGHLTVNRLFGQHESKWRLRRPWVANVMVSELEKIAPYNAEAKAALAGEKFDFTYDAVNTMSHADNYYTTWTDENGKRHLLYFQATNKALSIMSFLNKNNTVVTKVSI